MSADRSRLYVVRHKKTGTARIVDAVSSATAMRHVAKDEYKVEVGKAKEVALLASEGVLVEVAG